MVAKNNNQLKAKSCSGRSGNNSGRGDGCCGICGGSNTSVAATTTAFVATMATATVTAADNNSNSNSNSNSGSGSVGIDDNGGSGDSYSGKK